MAGRSLQASKAGIQRARQALARRSLIQRSLVDEGIASWSTVNKFFTGKPVARNIFQEICHRLDLEWQEICKTPDDPDPDDPLLLAVKQRSLGAREALIPRILQPILRPIVQERYLPAIRRGLQQDTPRMIPLIGPAGYGKSTILGHLYDALTAESSWTALLLCNSLFLDAGVSPEKLAISMGESICGEAKALPQITAALTHIQGKGTLLIDTLDLVISRPFIAAFTQVMRQLLEQGVTVVFTCRDYEYNDFLEPNHEKLPGIAQWMDRHNVPGFTTDEIQQAAAAFFAQLDPARPNQGQQFAQQILDLSADSRSLKEITQNPLLLALLCALFAQDGNVPADLTVSKLYRRYWREKIAYSRVDGSHTSLLALEKDQVCLAIARSLFEHSDEKLCESAYPDELGISFTASIVEAYNDLFSEGVLEVLPTRKVHFFHQTLLEYAIADWLNRRSAHPQRQQLIRALQSPDVAAIKPYWFPVLRQMLTILEDETEFEAIVQQLDLRNLGIFGTVALATASRDRPEAFLNLLPTALALGESYQERLRQALESTSHQFAEAGWTVLVTFLEQAEHASAINTAKTMSTLLARWWHRLQERLPSALDAISRRTPQPNQAGKMRDDRPSVFGWLLQQCWQFLESQSELTILATLRRYYALMGEETNFKIVQIHRQSHIPTSDQTELIQTILHHSFPRNEELETATVDLLTQFLPALMGDHQNAVWTTWQSALYDDSFPKWVQGITQAVGQFAATQPTILTEIVQDVLTSQGERLRRNLIALDAAIRAEAQQSNEETKIGQTLHQILAQPIQSLSPTCLTAIVRFLRHAADACTPYEQDQIANWVRAIAPTQPKLFVPLLDTLADHSSVARQTLPDLFAHLPAQEAAYQFNRLLRFQPIEQHPPLKTLDQPSQVFLVKFYRQQASFDPEAANRLLDAARSSKSKEVAIAAAQSLPDLAISVTQMLPLLQSQFIGVRDKALQAIAKLTEDGLKLSVKELHQVCLLLKQEDDQAVSRLLCEIVARWVQQYRQVPAGVPDTIGQLPARLLKKGTLDGGAARVLILAMKAIAQSEPDHLDLEQFNAQVRQLLNGISLVRVMRGEAEMLDLLSAVERLNGQSKQILAQIVQVDCPKLAQQGWERNIYAVIRTIRRTGHENTALLDEILNSSWCTQGIMNCLLEAKGV